MTSESMNHVGHDPSAERAGMNEPLGWEGHVNVPPSPLLTNLLRTLSEQQTGLTLSLAFVTGVLVGAILFSTFAHQKNTTT